MLAEKAVAKVDRSMERYARKMAALKNRMDHAQMLYNAKKEGLQLGREEGREAGRQEGRHEGRQEGRQEGRDEERQYLLELLSQGLSAEELKQRLAARDS